MSLSVLVDGRTIQDRWAGIGRLVFHLVDELARLPKTQVIVLAPDATGNRLRASDLHPDIELVDFHYPIVSRQSQTKLPSQIRRLKPDVFFAPYNLATPFLTLGVPVLTGVMDCIMEADSRFAPGRLFRIGYMGATKVLLSRSSGVFTISQRSRQDITDRYGITARRIHVAIPSADTRFESRLSNAEIVTMREELSLPESYLLHVGSWRPHKNITLLLEAFAQTRPPDRDLHLVLVGGVDPKYGDHITPTIKRLGLEPWVHALDNVPERWLPALYQSAELLVYPSILEGYGFPPAEAMLAGIPVIASSGVPSVTETGVGDGVIVLPPENPAVWAEAISAVLDDPDRRAAMVDIGRNAIRRHTWERAALDLRRALESVSSAK